MNNTDQIAAKKCDTCWEGYFCKSGLLLALAIVVAPVEGEDRLPPECALPLTSLSRALREDCLKTNADRSQWKLSMKRSIDMLDISCLKDLSQSDDLCLSIYSKWKLIDQEREGMTSERSEEFVSYIEKRLNVVPPVAWKRRIHPQLAGSGRDRIIEFGKVDSSVKSIYKCMNGTSNVIIKPRDRDTSTIIDGDISRVIHMPMVSDKGVLQWDKVFVSLEKSCTLIFPHSMLGGPCSLYCFGKNGELKWKSLVWVDGLDVVWQSGCGWHCAFVYCDQQRVVVLGCLMDAWYIEVFDLTAGSPLARFHQRIEIGG